MSKYPKINFSRPAVQDLHTAGINPLRCVICQQNKKLDGKMTCGSKDCISSFITPDLKEETPDETA